MIFDKGRERKWELMRIRQPGTTSEHDSRQVVTETFRRLLPEEDEPEQKSVFAKPGGRPTTVTPPEAADLIDRLHKWSSRYVVVSNDHNAGEDPIPNPGYRSSAVTFSTIQDAYNFAKNYLVPKLDLTKGTKNRVKVVVLGGYYEENLALDFGYIDLIGIGRPCVVGNAVLTAGTPPGPLNRMLIQDIEFYGTGGGVPALTVNGTLDFIAPPEGLPESRLEIDRCWLHGIGGGLKSSSRVLVSRCIIETDYQSETYTNLTTPALYIVRPAIADGDTWGWSEVRECFISGVIDHRTPAGANGRPNKGLAIYISNPLYVGVGSGTYYPDGVAVRNCTVTGYCRNEVWNLYFAHCDLYGGKKHPTAGDWFMFTQGNSATLATGSTWFDMCMIACRYLCEVADMTNPAATPTPATVYVQHSKQLWHGGDWAGASVIPGNTFGFTAGANGTTYVINSSTFREYWEFAVAESSIMADSNTALVLSANANMGAAPFGALLQLMLFNPYPWRW